jgi:hypothetical protein
MFPLGIREVPCFGSKKRWVLEVKRRGAKETADAYREKEKSGTQI